MDQKQSILLVTLGLSALIFVLVWVTFGRCPEIMEGYDTHNQPYPMYRNNNDHEGAYKYLDEYLANIKQNPFLSFPPVDNYTSRWYALRRKYKDFVGQDHKFFA